MIESLEERANRARQSIDGAVGSVPDRDFQPPRQHIGTVAAVLFAVLLAAGGLWAIARGDSPNAADVAADGPDAVSATEDEATVSDDPPAEETPDETASVVSGPVEAGAYLVFDGAPEGFEPMIAPEIAPAADEMMPVFDVYGTADGPPFANGDLVVAAIVVPDGETLVDADTPSVEVDGETIYLENDEGFSVVSWFRGTEGVGLLSQSMTEEQLVERLTGLIRTGELDTGDLDLLQEDVTISFAEFGGESTVVYRPIDGERTTALSMRMITVNSAPADTNLVTEWFLAAEGEVVSSSPGQTVEHNGWTITTGPSVEDGLELRFEVDGVPIHVTMIGGGQGQPTVEQALLLLSDIRGASAAEIESMKARGEDLWSFDSATD